MGFHPEDYNVEAAEHLTCYFRQSFTKLIPQEAFRGRVNSRMRLARVRMSHCEP